MLGSTKPPRRVGGSPEHTTFHKPPMQPTSSMVRCQKLVKTAFETEEGETCRLLALSFHFVFAHRVPRKPRPFLHSQHRVFLNTVEDLQHLVDAVFNHDDDDEDERGPCSSPAQR